FQVIIKELFYRKISNMNKEHKVEITRKDLYSKDYSRITYSNIEGEERKRSYVNKGIVDVLVQMVENFN
ncbi:TPA: hypothetical protein ACKFSY_004181, partial [Clostridioides difficile]